MEEVNEQVWLHQGRPLGTDGLSLAFLCLLGGVRQTFFAMFTREERISDACLDEWMWGGGSFLSPAPRLEALPAAQQAAGAHASLLLTVSQTTPSRSSLRSSSVQCTGHCTPS